MHLRLAIITGLICSLCFLAGVQARPIAEELILQGNRLCEQGKYQQALIKYQRVLKEYNSADAAYNLGVTYEVNLRDMKQALNYYQQFLSLEPDSDDAQQVKGWIEEIRISYPFVTLQRAKSLEDISPQLRQGVIAELKHAQDFYRQGNYKDAVKEYLEVLRIYDSADACYNLGLIYDKKLNQKQQAIKYYQQFLLLEPSSPDAEQVRQWIKEARETLHN